MWGDGGIPEPRDMGLSPGSGPSGGGPGRGMPGGSNGPTPGVAWIN